MGQDEELFEFAEDDEHAHEEEVEGEAWHILVVDDEPEVHSVTRLALNNFRFANRPIMIHSAYSASEAERLLSSDIEFALALVDVVMETEQAGLELVQWIRETQKNFKIRLVLRTGQAGQAPQRKVIEAYDINDYKEKTELTANKLYTLMYSSLRSYRDITSLHKNKEGLEQIVRSTSKIFVHQSLGEFTQGVLEQMCALLHIESHASLSEVSSFAAYYSEESSNILAATGCFANFHGQPTHCAFAESVADEETVTHLLKTGGQHFGKDYFIGVYDSHLGRKNILYLEGLMDLSEVDQELVQIFGNNVGIAFDNHAMFSKAETAQTEIMYCLGEVVEKISRDQAHRVERVTLICRFLEEKLNIRQGEPERLSKLVKMHDVEKVKTPLRVFFENNLFDRSHWASLEDTKMDHKNLDIGDQVTIVADAWDALLNRRCYKEPWPIDRVLAFFEEMKGRRFDARLVDIVKEHHVELMNIQNQFSEDASRH